MAETLLTLLNIVVRYGERVALRLASLDIESGGVLAIIGPNGAGKSTLLRVMGLLQRPSEGRVLLRGENALKANSLDLRRRIATVFQEPLLLNATVYQNAALGLKLRGMSGAEIERRLAPWLERLGIAHLARRSARTLSGGEARRTSLARAFALDPELLLLDEPFAALDPAGRESLLGDFQTIVKETKITTVVVSHDRDEAFALAERVGVLIDGRLMQVGEREEVFLRPRTESVAEIVGIENRLSGAIEGSDGKYSRVRVERESLTAAGTFRVGAQIALCIRSEDILIDRGICQSNGFNRLKGRIGGVSPGISRHRVLLNCSGFRLVASVERKTLLEGAHDQGEEITVLFDPAAIHIIETGN